jgi:hypothetical protein
LRGEDLLAAREMTLQDGVGGGAARHELPFAYVADLRGELPFVLEPAVEPRAPELGVVLVERRHVSRQRLERLGIHRPHGAIRGSL